MTSNTSSLSVSNDTQRRTPSRNNSDSTNNNKKNHHHSINNDNTINDTNNNRSQQRADEHKRRLRTLLDDSTDSSAVPNKQDNNNSKDSIDGSHTTNDQHFPFISPVLRPKPPSKCYLLGCFYSEFDIKRGTVIVSQSPPGVMDQDIHLPLSKMQTLLQGTFEELERKGVAIGVTQKSTDRAESNTGDDENPPPPPPPPDMEPEHEDKVEDGNHIHHHQDAENILKEGVNKGRHSVDPNYQVGDSAKEVPEEGKTARSFTTSTSSHGDSISTSGVATTGSGGGGGTTISIFDSTSEFIITGSELTSKIITLSAHSWHVMSRPTMISNSRYERNAHLFSVGFLLRRAADPRPFRPLLSKLAVTLQAMEEESGFLTRVEYRPKLQTLLERVLLSLNSVEYECNLLLSSSNALHLKLYHIPKAETSPVHQYQVPILLRREVHLQMVKQPCFCYGSTCKFVFLSESFSFMYVV